MQQIVEILITFSHTKKLIEHMMIEREEHMLLTGITTLAPDHLCNKHSFINAIRSQYVALTRFRMQQVVKEILPWFTFSLTEGTIFTKHMIIEGDKHIFHISYRDNNFSVWSSVKQTCIISCWNRYVLNTICILCLLTNYDDKRFVAIKKKVLVILHQITEAEKPS